MNINKKNMPDNENAGKIKFQNVNLVKKRRNAIVCPQADTLISVILPVYNAEKYVAQAIESVLLQTYTNIELIIINDGSTDNSGKICKRYKSDSRVRYYYQSNQGLSRSRQFGIDQCKGTYFLTIDADDYILDVFIEKMYSKIIETNADICICSWQDFYDGSDIKYERPLQISYDFFKITPDLLRLDFRKIGGRLTLSDSWNKLYRTEFVRRSGVKFELPSKFNGNDLAFNYKLLLHCPSYTIIKDPLLNHRITPISMVRRKKIYLQEGFNCITDQIKKEMDNSQIEASYQLSLFYYHLLSLVFWDKLNYSISIKECVSELSEYLDIHSKYLKTRNIIPVNISDFNSWNRLIVGLMQKKMKLGLLCFGVFIKIKRKLIGRKNEL